MAKSTSPRPPSPRKPRAPKSSVGIAKVVSIVPTALDTVPLDTVPLDTAPLDPARVAMRAYELFLESGSVHGHDVEHWLRAEREIMAGRLTSAA